jgi:putative SOS response-associated peptidase YedK
MCGRYDLSQEGKQLEMHFDIDLSHLTEESAGPAPYPAYNIAPTDQVLSIVSDGQRNYPELMHWGLVHFWIKKMSDSSRMINARAETVSERPVYQKAFAARRCLIPATGFFEWRKGPGKTRQPMRIMLKSEEPFAFAGIWEQASPKNFPEVREITSCSIITTVANELVLPIHDRMPVILPPELYAAWLNPDNPDIGELKEFLLPFDASLMKAYPVSALVNSVRNKGPEVLAPATSLL